jgi:transposase InsO family protein
MDVFVVMELKTRRIIHTGVTKYPTDEWTAQQLREAAPWGKGPKYLIRDRDKKYATHFSAVAMSSGIQELKTPFRTPQANGYCERFMGSLRRECMDHILIHDDQHLGGWSRSTRHTSIRSDPIRGLVSAFLNIMIYQSQG